VDSLLSEIEATLPSALADGNTTITFVGRLVRERPDRLDEAAREGLDALCRKVDIVRQVRVAYDESWKKAADMTPLPLEHWPALVAALLLAADRSTREPDGKGKALKLINTAFNAITLYRDRAKDPEPPFLAALEDWAARSLDDR